MILKKMRKIKEKKRKDEVLYMYIIFTKNAGVTMDHK